VSSAGRPGRSLEQPQQVALRRGRIDIGVARIRITKSSTSSYDTGIAGRLWQVSADMVGLERVDR
jgi:hypothetical protein